VLVTYNPRFVAYARSIGFDDPADALAHDRERYPGGVLAGFLLFVHEHAAAFKRARPDLVLDDTFTLLGHARFTQHLLALFPRKASRRE